jgi:hypothetical protein
MPTAPGVFGNKWLPVLQGSRHLPDPRPGHRFGQSFTQKQRHRTRSKPNPNRVQIKSKTVPAASQQVPDPSRSSRTFSCPGTRGVLARRKPAEHRRTGHWLKNDSKKSLNAAALSPSATAAPRPHQLRPLRAGPRMQAERQVAKIILHPPRAEQGNEQYVAPPPAVPIVMRLMRLRGLSHSVRSEAESGRRASRQDASQPPARHAPACAHPQHRSRVTMGFLQSLDVTFNGPTFS